MSDAVPVDSKEAKVEVLKTVRALAWADGELSAAEQRLLDFLIDTSGLSAEQEAAVRAQQGAAVDLSQLAAVVTEPRDRAWAYEVAALVSQMDGSQDPAEWALLNQLKPVLQLDEETARQAEARARTIYEKFTAHQSGADAEESDPG
jgi:uncharacterized membrane protein YebE (DUF533 family)